VEHVGIVVGYDCYGKPIIAATSLAHGQGRYESWDAFIDGRSWRVDGNYQSKVPTLEILLRVEQVMDRPYAVQSWNCEHFVTHCLGLPVESRQLQKFIAIGGVLLVVAIFTRAA
jgi:hypothetical protein